MYACVWVTVTLKSADQVMCSVHATYFLSTEIFSIPYLKGICFEMTAR